MAFIKNNWLAVLLLSASLACFIAFNLIGTRVNSEGYLVEPFALIPMFWLLFLGGLICLVRRIYTVNKSLKE